LHLLLLCRINICCSAKSTIYENIQSDIIRNYKHQNVSYEKYHILGLAEEAHYALLDVMIEANDETQLALLYSGKRKHLFQ